MGLPGCTSVLPQRASAERAYQVGHFMVSPSAVRSPGWRGLPAARLRNRKGAREGIVNAETKSAANLTYVGFRSMLYTRSSATREAAREVEAFPSMPNPCSAAPTTTPVATATVFTAPLVFHQSAGHPGQWKMSLSSGTLTPGIMPTRVENRLDVVWWLKRSTRSLPELEVTSPVCPGNSGRAPRHRIDH